MDLSSSMNYTFISRTQSHYNELNDNINKLIEDLGIKIQGQFISIQERTLVKYKDNLVNAQNNYRELQETRNDQVIKENVFNLKTEQERKYHQESEKSVQMNKMYDKLKLELKKGIEYQHQLQLEINFLTKQCKIAKAKSEMLEEQIKQFQQKKNMIGKSKATLKNYSFKLTKQNTLSSIENATKFKQNYLKRLKNKIENLKEYLELVEQEDTTLQKIFKKYDMNSCKSQRSKLHLAENIFNDKEFKKYIYHILFEQSK